MELKIKNFMQSMLDITNAVRLETIDAHEGIAQISGKVYEFLMGEI